MHMLRARPPVRVVWGSMQYTGFRIKAHGSASRATETLRRE